MKNTEIERCNVRVTMKTFYSRIQLRIDYKKTNRNRVALLTEKSVEFVNAITEMENYLKEWNNDNENGER